MAIIVEEERNRSNVTGILGWVIVVSIILAAAYYLFLAQPEAATVTPPATLQNLVPITKINFDPVTVVQSQGFQSLKQYVSEPTSTGPAGVGRPDPFVAP